MTRIAWLTALAAAIALPQAGAAQGEPEPYRVAVERKVRDGEDCWVARFTFPSDAPIWALQRSALTREGGSSWRIGNWHIVTKGVSLERIGDFEALVAQEDTMPREVEITFTPLAVDLQADYDPALILSNGSLALYSGQFQVFPAQSREELAGLTSPGDHAGQITMRDSAGQVIYHGAAYNSATLEGGGYVIFGPVTLVAGEHVSSVIDPGLPQWLAEELQSYTAQAFDSYTARLGEHAAGHPTLMASWGGPTPNRASLGGSVTSDMVTMRFEGDALLSRESGALDRAQWFIGHEAAHFWLGRTIRYADMDDMWITEGGADLMAVRLQQQLGGEAAMDDDAYFAEARGECIAFLARGSLLTARRRQEHQAYYSCGSLFALAVEQAGAPRGEDFFDFVSALIDGNPDGVATMQEWLAAARAFGVSEERIAIMRDLLENGSADGARALDSLLLQ